MTKLRFLTIFLAIVISSHLTKAQLSQQDIQPPSTEAMFKKAEAINSIYLKNIKSIFSKKCFDCHSNQTVYPWYYSLPVVKQMLDNDIAEGKKHIDMSDDFPFAGHGSAEEDLKAIRDSTNKGEMPPFKYWVLHPKTKLTKDEKKEINKWIDESLKTMSSHE